jgi:hypothetical protein
MCHTLAVKITTKLKDESMAKSRKKTTTVAKIEAKETQHSRFLLLDSRLIASTRNAVLKLGCVKKHDENPLFTEEKPWEQRFNNTQKEHEHVSRIGFRHLRAPWIIGSSGR